MRQSERLTWRKRPSSATIAIPIAAWSKALRNRSSLSRRADSNFCSGARIMKPHCPKPAQNARSHKEPNIYREVGKRALGLEESLKYELSVTAGGSENGRITWSPRK